MTRQDKAERQAQIAKRKLEVGHILLACWGYDQTNVEFFQVTKLIDAHSVELCEIAQDVTETGWAQGTTLPKLDHFIGQPIVKRDLGGMIKFESNRWAYIWQGKPAYWTAYA